MSLADRYNQMRSRTDCEWIDTPDGGVALAQTRGWTQAYTKHLASKAERDRQQFNHRQNYPIQEAAE